MTGIVVDFETAPGSPQQLWALGVKGAAVYTNNPNKHWPKDVTLAYVQAAVQIAGFGLVFIAEIGISDYQGGSTNGANDGADWKAGADGLLLPTTVPALPTFDTDVPMSEWPVAADYLRGFIAAVAPHPVVSAYCAGGLGEYLVSLGLIQMVWESMSTGFIGNKTPTAHTTMRQVAGLTVPGLGGSYDANDILAVDWGQWPRPNTAPVLEGPEVKLICSRVKSTAPGRDAYVTFDAANKRLIGFNGADFAPATDFTITHGFGVAIATLTGATNGSLDYGEHPDGTRVVITADGDGGTFAVPYGGTATLNPLPVGPKGDTGPKGDPGAPGAPGPLEVSALSPTDLESLATAVAAHLKVAAE